MGVKLSVPIDILVGAYDVARTRAEIAKVRSYESPSMHDAYLARQKELFKAALELGDAMIKEKREEAK